MQLILGEVTFCIIFVVFLAKNYNHRHGVYNITCAASGCVKVNSSMRVLRITNNAIRHHLNEAI